MKKTLCILLLISIFIQLSGCTDLEKVVKKEANDVYYVVANKTKTNNIH